MEEMTEEVAIAERKVYQKRPAEKRYLEET